MPLSGILKTFFKQEPGQQPKITSFKPGQIVHGKIIKLFPNQLAEVQVGSQKLIANLEIPLSAGERYWFQVQPGDGKLHLKLLAASDAAESKNGDQIENLLGQLGLPATKGNVEFVRFILKERLALPNDVLPMAAEWLDEVSSRSEGMETIQIMAERKLPFTKNVFLSVHSLQAKLPLHELIGETLHSLDSEKQTETVPQLKGMLKTFLQPQESELLISENGHAGKHLKNLIASLGLGFENELFEKELSASLKEESQSLKPLLIRYLNEQSESVHKTPAEHLLQRMNGMQLLSHDNGPVMQFLTQVPLSFLNHATDLSIQWNGRKQDDGKIDPNYCRVLFYLHLQSIGDTIVDMQVQNRILSLSISSERNDLKEISAPFFALLKTKLKELDYHLSSISFENSLEEKKGAPMKKTLITGYESKVYGGVDFRI